MKRKKSALLQSYQTALLRHLKHGSEADLESAKKLGRLAVKQGLETLDLALIHETALIPVVLALRDNASFTEKRIVRQAGKFFAEAVLPMEKNRRMMLHANGRLNELNQELHLRTRELTTSNRKLKMEIARRKTAQESLRRNEVESDRLLKQSCLFQKQLRLLSRQILSAQEEERKRISRELHDVIAQMLTGINIRLATLKKEITENNKGLSRKITHAQRMVEKSVDIVHRFARELRPAVLDDLGLVPALQSYLKVFTKQTGIRVNFKASSGFDNLTSAKRTVLYRVAQEALTNAARHAKTGLVDVIPQSPDSSVLLQIKDKNKGFNVEEMWRGKKSSHLGMIGMRERVEMAGGVFTVESKPGRGTTINALIPFKNGKKRESS